MNFKFKFVTFQTWLDLKFSGSSSFKLENLKLIMVKLDLTWTWNFKFGFKFSSFQGPCWTLYSQWIQRSLLQVHFELHSQMGYACTCLWDSYLEHFPLITWQTCKWPFSAALWRGAVPSQLGGFLGSYLGLGGIGFWQMVSMINLQTWWWPFIAAMCKGVKW